MLIVWLCLSSLSGFCRPWPTGRPISRKFSLPQTHCCVLNELSARDFGTSNDPGLEVYTIMLGDKHRITGWLPVVWQNHPVAHFDHRIIYRILRFCTMITVHACTMIIVHACTMIIVNKNTQSCKSSCGRNELQDDSAKPQEAIL